MILSLSMLSSCEEDNKNFTAGTGTITPTITVDASIVSSRGEDLGQLGFDIPKPDDFSLRMTDESGSHTGEWKSISQFSPEMPYRVGTYLMTATFNEGAEGYDMPSFKGEASLAVDNGTNTPVDIKCSIANAIIDVNYSDGIGKLLQDSIIIISQKYHNERALYQAKHLGIEAIGYNAQTPGRRTSWWRNRGREVLARVKLFIDIARDVQPDIMKSMISDFTEPKS